MNKLDFWAQIRLGVGILFASLALASITRIGWLGNMGHIIFGLLFIVNPVWPPSWVRGSDKRKRLECRIAGVIIIILGLMWRSNL